MSCNNLNDQGLPALKDILISSLCLQILKPLLRSAFP